MYSVECKARVRQTYPTNADGSPRIDVESIGIARKLKAALSKTALYERVVFIDIDMPDLTTFAQLEEVANVSEATRRDLAGTLEIYGIPAPPAYVAVTNMPDHRRVEDASYGFQAFVTGFKIPDFGGGVVYHGMHARLKARERQVVVQFDPVA